MTSKRDKIKQNRSQLYRQNEDLEADTIRLEVAGKLLLWKSRGITNIGNLIFAGVVAGGIFEDIGHPWIVLSSGISVVAACYLAGYKLYKKGIKLWRG